MTVFVKHVRIIFLELDRYTFSAYDIMADSTIQLVVSIASRFLCLASIAGISVSVYFIVIYGKYGEEVLYGKEQGETRNFSMYEKEEFVPISSRELLCIIAFGFLFFSGLFMIFASRKWTQPL